MIKIPYLDVFVQYIHSWYPAACCSDRDCKPVACETINQLVALGQLAQDKIQASQDALCHLCTSSAGDHLCAFIVLSY